MSGDKRNEMQTVSSVGNSWIVTHSKSHQGRVYYFNTLTGEAVWNLSEIESERARQRTKVLEPDSIPAKCPEPSNNPPHNVFHQEPQIPNNVNQEQMVSTYSNIAVTGLSPFNFNDKNKQIKSLNIISTPAAPNHSPWPVPLTQQFFITPSIPVVNQGQASMNMEYGHMLHDSQPGVSGCNAFHSPHTGRRLLNNNTVASGGHFNRFKRPLQKNDLRKRLALRKKLRNNTYQTEEFNNPESIFVRNNEGGSNCEGINMMRADIGAHIASMIEEVRNTCEMKDKAQVQNRPNIQTEENDSYETLDLSPLKCLAPSNANPSIWYIVVDYKVLLEKFELLNRMTNSDKSCCLCVPHIVLTELKAYIACSNNIPARRIFQCLSQEIGTGGVLLGQKLSQDSGVSISNPILKTCFDLMEENYHVILLTNDSSMLNYKKFIKVNMFTIDEIKILLKESLHEDQPEPDPPTHLQVSSIESSLPLENIKITIPGQQTSEIEKVAEDENEKNVETVCDKELTDNETSQSVEVNVPSKCTVDAAIQTDIVILPSNDIKEDERPTLTNKTEAQNTRIEIQDSNTIETTQESGVVMPPVKRRAIKLKRSVSHQPVPSNPLDKGNEKKPIRWRSRKRLGNCQQSASNSNMNPPNSHDGINIVSVHTNTTNEISNNKTGNEQTSNSDEIAESRDSSIVSISAKRDSIVIEETSTSGIISNTESNIDGQSELTDYKENQSLESNECRVRIDSEFMEESLQTKCEEWVSRFTQIMEEVLAVVLHKEPSFSNVEMPPPWTVHEAAQCIRKSTNVPSVKRASEKLSGILFFLSDSVGKITTNVTAHQYMEMYDSGVSLLAALKDVMKCEDIEIAEESLRKLLIDIKNPYYGSNDSVIDLQENLQISGELNDSAPEKRLLEAKQDDTTPKRDKYNLRSKSTISIETPVQPLRPVKNILNIYVKSSFLSNNLQKKICNHTQSNTSFSRSRDSTNERPCETLSSDSNDAVIPISKATNTPNIEPVQPTQPAEIIRNIDVKSSFLSSLNLQKICNQTQSNTSFSRSQDRTNERPCEILSSGSNDAVIPTSKATNTPNIEPVQPTQPVKIIRNIDVKSSFLSHLNLQKSNCNQIRSNTLFSRSQDRSNERPCITFSSDSNDAIIPTSKATNSPNIVRNFTKCPEFEERLRKKLENDAFEDNDEFLDDEDYMYTADGGLEDINMSDGEGLESDPNVTQVSSDLDISGNLVSSSPKAVDPSLAKESNNRFKYIICMFLKEVRNAINDVKVLCDKCYAELNNPQLPPTQRNELKIQIENAHLHIVGLCLSLEGMLDRDPNAPTDNIQTVLKKAGINVSHVDERLLSSYWETIANCKKHADVFLFSVRDIIAGFKSLSS